MVGLLFAAGFLGKDKNSGVYNYIESLNGDIRRN